MYESILKVATGDPEFEFKTRNTPMPLTYMIGRRVNTANAGTIIFMTGVAFPLIITQIISYLVVERIT